MSPPPAFDAAAAWSLNPEALAPRLRGLARAIVRDEARSEDVVQSVWLRAVVAQPGRRPGVRTWLLKVCRNLALNAVRGEQRLRRREAAAARSERLPPASEDVELRQAAAEVRRALADLREPYRTAVYLRFFEDLPPRDIAVRLGVPVTTAQSRIQKGLSLLRDDLAVLSDPGRGGWRNSLVALAGLGFGWRPRAVAAILGAALLVTGWALRRGDIPDHSPLPTTITPTGVLVAGGNADPAPAPITANPFRDDAGDRRIRKDDGVVLECRAHLTGRHPAAGAEASLFVERDAAAFTATADAEGRFRFPLPAALAGATAGLWIHTRDAAGAALLTIAPGNGALPPITLGPAASLDLRVSDEGRPAAAARVGLRLLDQHQPGLRMEVFLGRHETDAQGRLRLDGLPAGPCAIQIRGASGRAACVIEDLGPAGGGTRVDLAAARTIAVRAVDRESGEPLAGVRVRVRGQFGSHGEHAFALDLPDEPPPTGATGRTRIEGLPEGLTLFAYDAAWDPLLNRDRIPCARVSADGETILGTRRWRPIEWPVAEDDAASPATDDPQVTLHWAVGGAWLPRGIEGRWRDGRLVVPLLPPVTAVLARAGDGRTAVALVPGPGASPEPMRFGPPRHLTVKLHDEQLRPLRGVQIFAQPGATGEIPGITEFTDAAGRARLGPLPGGVARVKVVSAAGAERADARIVDPEAPRVTEIPLDGVRRITIRTFVDGVRKLPDHVAIRASPHLVSRPDEDPAAGTLAFLLWGPSGPASLEFRSEGGAPVPVDLPAGDEVEAEARFAAATALTVRVLPPADGDRHWVPPGLEREETPGTWVLEEQAPRRATSSGGIVFPGLAPGRWRVRAADASAVTDTVEVASGGAPVALTLDLSDLCWVRGAVALPAGADPAAVRITVGVEGLPLRDVRTDPGVASFAVRVPRGRPVRLEARHPRLEAEGPESAVTLEGPKDGVVLRPALRASRPSAPAGRR